MRLTHGSHPKNACAGWLVQIHLMRRDGQGPLTKAGSQTRRKDRSMTDTQVKVAIVTGASGGIGRAVALRLARDGFRVVLNYAGNAGHAEAAAAEIKAAGGHAFAVQADVADAAAVERLFQETLGAFGRIDVVVNSAGIMPMGPIAEGSLEAFDRVIATNLRGSFIVMAQAAKHVAKGGRIIMFSSSVIAKSFPNYGPTSPRKPAWRAWFRCSPTNCAAARSPSTRWRLARCRRS